VKPSSSDDVDFSKAVLGDQSEAGVEDKITCLAYILAKHEKMFSTLPASPFASEKESGP
jgi:hypothetical protein